MPQLRSIAPSVTRLSSRLMTISVFPVNSSAPVSTTIPSPKANKTPDTMRITLAEANVYVAMPVTHTGNPISAPAAMPNSSSFTAAYCVLTTPAAA